MPNAHVAGLMSVGQSLPICVNGDPSEDGSSELLMKSPPANATMVAAKAPSPGITQFKAITVIYHQSVTLEPVKTSCAE